ncbi:flagellin [Nisaea sp.]|uniref:flagellin n=1 Tax=Nisaea sp. TaxID=2024842 RepID=UPI0025F86269|nr:flagellin [Nisaea sp.]
MAISNSVLTNPASFVALRNLNQINRDLDTTQDRVSTGLRVTGALDDASNFAIAQGIRTEISAISSVIQGLNNAKGIGKVALAGLTGISNLLIDMRGKLTELANEGITQEQRDILVNDYGEMLDQALDFANNAEYNGVNLLNENAGVDTQILSNLQGDTLTLSGAKNGSFWQNPGDGHSMQTWITSTKGALSDLRNGGGGFTAAEVAQRELEVNVGDGVTYYDDLDAAVRRYTGRLAAEVRALDLQTSFLESLSDATEEGLGNIVDADLARESATLTAVQVQQQLSTQTLGIANQRPQTLLGLFR